MSEERFDRLERQMQEFSDRTDRRFETGDERFEAIDRRIGTIDKKIDDLGLQMSVFHREMRDQIRAMSGPPVVSPSTTWMADIDRKMAAHDGLVPVVREHDVTLRRHEQEIDKLKH